MASHLPRLKQANGHSAQLKAKGREARGESMGAGTFSTTAALAHHLHEMHDDTLGLQRRATGPATEPVTFSLVGRRCKNHGVAPPLQRWSEKKKQLPSCSPTRGQREGKAASPNGRGQSSLRFTCRGPQKRSFLHLCC